MRDKIETVFRLIVISVAAVWFGMLILSVALIFSLSTAEADEKVQGVATPDLTCRVRNHNGQLVRSAARRARFLREVMHINDGKVPQGFIVDHVIPLSCGGCDLPSNLELLTVDEWRAKARWERQPCSAWSDGSRIRLLQKAIDESKP